MAREKVFVIRNAQGMLYTECDIVGVKDSIETDGTGNKFVHQRHVLAPRFDSNHVGNCSKFGSQEDADGMMRHPDLEDPQAFSGCTVADTDDL